MTDMPGAGGDGHRPAEDRFELDRFVRAQDDGTVYERAMAEVRAGAKRSHWMWFVYPQIAGLGGSPMARRYAIADLVEARAYLAHPVLGPRLSEAARAAATTPGTSAESVFGGVDALKLRSSMTLFLRAADGMDAAPGHPERAWAAAVAQSCRDVLDRFFAGVKDPATERLLANQE